MGLFVVYFKNLAYAISASHKPSQGIVAKPVITVLKPKVKSTKLRDCLKNPAERSVFHKAKMSNGHFCFILSPPLLGFFRQS